MRPLTGTLSRIIVSAALAAAAGLAVPPAANAAFLQLARGTFTVSLDLGTLTAVPVNDGAKCDLTVDAVLGFAGTVQGTAKGSTTATVDATCAQALATPPGTYSDSFDFTGKFTGAISGRSRQGAATEYKGVTSAGGNITAGVIIQGSPGALLTAQAKAGAGGTYWGTVS